MANWYYHNANGEKVGPISPSALKELARQGAITQETKIENSDGYSGIAGKVNGLMFPNTIPPKPRTETVLPTMPATPPPPPVAEANPFIAPMPSANQSVQQANYQLY